MLAEWIKGFKPESILNEINETITSREAGKISFSNFNFHELIVTLTSMVHFSKKLKGHSYNAIISLAVTNTAIQGVLTKEGVIKEVKSIALNKLATKEKKYHLLTSVSFKVPPVKSISSDGCRIRLQNNLESYPKKYRDRGALLNKHENVLTAGQVSYT
jgi:hypothetical protein